MTAPTPSPVAPSWTADQFWQFVGGLAGDFESEQMRCELSERGLVIVPREPTEAMLEAGEETFVCGMKGTPVSTPLDVWTAMISAATLPAAQGKP